MSFDFPDAPLLDDEHTPVPGGPSYYWDGAVWRVGSAPTPPPDTFVLKAGDVMTGPLVLPSLPPIDATFAASKGYVDAAISAAALYQGVWQVAANVPDLTPSVANPLHTYGWIAITVDPAVPETAPAGLPGIGGMGINEGDNVIWNDTLQIYDLIRAVGAVGNYVSKAGDTMTGTLVAPSMEIMGTAQAASGVRLFPAAPPNAGRIDFQTADGATRKGYIGYGGDTDLILHAETGVQWRVVGHFAVGGNVVLSGANHGINFPGGSRIYDHTDKPLRICGRGDMQPQVANADGTAARNIVDTNGAAFTGGISFGSVAQTDVNDLSRHIALWGTAFGFQVVSNQMNYLVPTAAGHCWRVNGIWRGQCTDAGFVSNAALMVADAAGVATMKADATLAKFVTKVSDEVGEAYDVSKLLLHALAKIKLLEAEIEQLKGR